MHEKLVVACDRSAEALKQYVFKEEPGTSEVPICTVRMSSGFFTFTRFQILPDTMSLDVPKSNRTQDEDISCMLVTIETSTIPLIPSTVGQAD
jgi:hypothetical protein